MADMTDANQAVANFLNASSDAAHEEMLDECARRMGRDPVRARRVRDCMARDELRAAAREVLDAVERGDRLSVELHGAALADMVMAATGGER